MAESPWIADAHVDLLLEVAARRARHEPNPFGEHWLPQLREGGVRLQVCPIYVQGPLVPDSGVVPPREAVSDPLGPDRDGVVAGV